jgi:hypothetical protein
LPIVIAERSYDVQHAPAIAFATSRDAAWLPHGVVAAARGCRTLDPISTTGC